MTIPGPSSLSGKGGQGGSNLIAVRLPPKFSKQTRQTEMRISPPTRTATAGAALVPADNPGVEVGGVIEHQIEQQFLAGQGKRPLDETPSGAANPAKDEDRIAPFHGVFLRRVWRPLGVCVGGLGRSLPAGINWTIATPKGGAQDM